MAVSEKSESAERAAKLWPMSVQAYRTLGELGFIPKNTELLYGQVFQKMSKSPLHSALVRRLLRLLQAALPPGCFISSEQPITCADSEPEPDIAVIRGAEDEFWRQHPTTAEVVIEVCVSSHEYDRSKLRAYASAGVKEVWLILVPERQIEVHSGHREGGFRERASHGPGGRFARRTLPGFTVDLDALFEK
jgi:Uma2 family endonuclease